MLHKKSWLGASAAVVTLLVGMMAAGCGSDKSTSPSATLNGKWGMSSDDGFVVCELKTDNTFEMKVEGNLFSKGTYAANSPNFTMTATHAHGAAVNAKAAKLFPVFISGAGITFEIEAKWYTKSELKTAILDKFEELSDILAGLDLGDIYSGDDFEEEFGGMFEPQIGTYALNGNTLTVTHSNGVDIFKRQ